MTKRICPKYSPCHPAFVFEQNHTKQIVQINSQKSIRNTIKKWRDDTKITPEEKQERKIVAPLLFKAHLLGIHRHKCVLNLSNHRHLTRLPEGLKIYGDLNLSQCEKLHVLPKSLLESSYLMLYLYESGITSQYIYTQSLLHNTQNIYCIFDKPWGVTF